MTRTMIQKKLTDLEAEIRILKTAVRRQPNFAVDERNWRKVKPALKKARREVSKQAYG